MNNTTTSTTSAPLLPLREIAGNPPTHLYPMQEFLLPYTNWIMAFWIALWCMTAIVLLWKLFGEYRNQSKKADTK